MIITRTPFRVSFVGGGTDIPDFYMNNGYGAVISTAIKQYMYIVIHPYFHDRIRIKYSKTEDVSDVQEIKHPIVRECLKRVGIDNGVEIASFADISSGTGLGSSSAFTVGLLNALYAYKGKITSKEALAKEACEIEIETLNEPIGKQDQFAAAYGNLNHIRFNSDKSVEVSPLLLTDNFKTILENYFRLYYVGGQRNSRDILLEQNKNILEDSSRFEQLKNMLNLVSEFKNALILKNFDEIPAILQKGWKYKKNLTDKISNQQIETIYNQALSNGAKGGKLLGAGGAGFLLIYHENHNLLSSLLKCRSLPFQIDREGSKIIYYQ